MKTKLKSILVLALSTPALAFAHGAHGSSPENEGTHFLTHIATFPLEYPIVSILTLLALTGLVVYRKPILNAIRA